MTATSTYLDSLNQYRRLTSLGETVRLLWAIVALKIGLEPGREGVRRMQNWAFFQRLVPLPALTPLTLSKNEIIIAFRNAASEKAEVKVALRVPFCESSDSLVFDQVFMRQDYFHALEWFSKAQPGDQIRTVMDVGANIGCTALFLSTQYSEADIFCLEPEASNYARLVLNVGLNPGRKIRCFRGALSTRGGKLTLSEDFKAGNDWGAQFVESPERSAGEERGQQVDAIEVWGLRDKAGFDRVDFFKMDIEGAEAGLLRDSRFKLFLKEKVQRVAIEVHEEFIKTSEAKAVLESLDFKTGLVAEFVCGVKMQTNTGVSACPSGHDEAVPTGHRI
jgi:FkbM family methyltransferase